MKNKKLVIIVLIVALVIGFAGISTTLIINGIFKIGVNTDDFDVIFTEAKINGTGSSAVISEDKKTITFSTSKLTSMEESSILDYKVMNQSTQYNAEATINCTTEETEYIGVVNELGGDIIGQNYKTVLGALEERSGVITAKLIKPYSGEDRSITITCIIDVKPTDEETTTTTTEATTEPTTEEIDDGKTRYNLTIDPNGGIYNGSEKIIETKIIENSTITLDEVSKKDYIFSHWLLNDEEVLESNSITITDDTKVKAIYVPISEAVARIDEQYFLSIQKAFNAAKTNDEVVLLKDTEEKATNTKNIYFNLDSHKVTGQITNTGQIRIDNGTIENTNGSAIENKGTLTLGNNDNTVSITVPSIIGTNIGIEQKGTFNFYDGVIEGKIGINGNYKDIPTDYNVFVDHNDEKDCQKVYLVKELNNAVVKTIDDGVVYYKNLQDAIRSSELSGKEIYTIRDFEAAYELNISEGKTINFDIVGHNVEFGNKVINNGTLNILNSNSPIGQLNPSITITNNNILNIKDIEITETTDANIITNNGELRITNSKLTALNGYAIYNHEGTKVTLDNNTNLKSNTYSFYNDSTNEKNTILSGGNIDGIHNKGNLTLEGNIIVKPLKNLYTILNGKNLTINNGTYTNYESHTTILNNGGPLIINKGEISAESATAIYNTSGILEINGGSIKADQHCVHNASRFTLNNGQLETTSTDNAAVYDYAGVFEMSGGNIIAENNIGVYIISSSSQNISAGIIKAKTGIFADCFSSTVDISGGNIIGEEYGIRVSRSTTNITGGTIKGGIYGIYSSHSESKLNIGTDDNIIKNDMSIVGDTYALYIGSGAVNIYDGIFYGKTDTVYGLIRKMPDAYDLSHTSGEYNNDNYYISELIKKDNFIKNGNTEYNSIVTAFEEANSGDKLIVIQNTSIFTPVELPKNKKLTIDLNGHEINYNNTITNRGELIIKDSSENKNGKIIFNGTVGINNSSSDGIFTLESSNLEIQGTSNILLQFGEISIMNSNLSGNGILIRNPNKLTIDNSNLTTSNFAVHSTNNYKNAININNSTFESIDGVAPLISIPGNVIITDSTITAKGFTSSNPLISLSNTTSSLIKGSTINNPYYDAISVQSSPSLTIEESNISSSNYAISIDKATIYIKSGIIKSTLDNAIYSRSNGYYDFINIGENDDSITKETPIIIGKKYGVYTYYDTAAVNFYDGIIKGGEAPTNRAISTIAEAARIEDGEETIDGTNYQTKYLIEEEKIVEVNGIQYNSIKKAINAIETEGTISLISDAIIKYAWDVPEDKNITLDLKGHNLTNSATITNNGTLSIADSIGEGTILSTNNTYLISSNGTTNINDITISAEYGVIQVNSGTLNITNANLKSTITMNNNTIYQKDGSTFINNSNVDNLKGSTIYVMNGSLELNNSFIDNSHNSESINYSGSSEIIQNGGVINTRISTTSSNTKYTMNSGEIKSNVTNYGEFILNDGTINHVYSYKLFTMNGGTISQGIQILNNTTMNVYGGKVLSPTTYAIELNKNSTLNIGKNDGTVTEDIIIQGATYGIYGGYVNFYDGKILGKTEAYNTTINKIATDKKLEHKLEEIDGETYYIAYLTNPTDIITNGTKNYTNFEDAINEANNGTTLSLLKDTHEIDDINIGENKNINLDLKGYSIHLDGKGKIINSGTLKILDSSSNKSGIITKLGTNEIINNSSTLRIENASIQQKNLNYYNIENNGSLYIKDSNISSTTKGINNKIDATLEITGSKITTEFGSSHYGIYNDGNLNIENSDLVGYYNIYTTKNSGDITLNSITSTSSSYSVSTIYLYDGENEVHIDDSTIKGLYTPYSGKVKININNSTLSATSTLQGTCTSNKNVYDGVVNLTSRKNSTTTVTSTNDTYNSSITSNAQVTFNSPQFSNSEITLNANSTTTINDGTMENNTQWGNIIENRGTLTINKMNINSNTTSNANILVNHSGTLNIDNLNINATGSYTTQGIVINGGDATLLSGSIKISNTRNKDAYGVVVNGGSLTMGVKEDGTVSETDPYIEAISQGRGIGVKKNNGYFNFYDGKIVGSTNAKPDTTSDVEYLYEATIEQDPETGYETCVLKSMN